MYRMILAVAVAANLTSCGGGSDTSLPLNTDPQEPVVDMAIELPPGLNDEESTSNFLSNLESLDAFRLMAASSTAYKCYYAEQYKGLDGERKYEKLSESGTAFFPYNIRIDTGQIISFNGQTYTDYTVSFFNDPVNEEGWRLEAENATTSEIYPRMLADQDAFVTPWNSNDGDIVNLCEAGSYYEMEVYGRLLAEHAPIVVVDSQPPSIRYDAYYFPASRSDCNESGCGRDQFYYWDLDLIWEVSGPLHLCFITLDGERFRVGNFGNMEVTVNYGTALMRPDDSIIESILNESTMTCQLTEQAGAMTSAAVVSFGQIIFQ